MGEANYELLPDGDGELGMAVARDWRGWLGAYLLDTLVDAAAARACPTSRPTSSSPTGGCCPCCGPRLRDAAVGRLGQPAPDGGHRGPHARGPPAGRARPIARPRVLVETLGPLAGRGGGGGRRAGGDHVLGPAAAPRVPGPRRPALPLAAGADAVVVAHAPDDDRWAALVRGPPTCTRAFRCASRPGRAPIWRCRPSSRRRAATGASTRCRTSPAQEVRRARRRHRMRKTLATIPRDSTITEAAEAMDRLAVGALVVVELWPAGRHRDRPRPRSGRSPAG